MRIRVRKLPKPDGWHEYYIESKKWYDLFWQYEGMRFVNPHEGKTEDEVAKEAIEFAEYLRNPLIIEIQ